MTEADFLRQLALGEDSRYQFKRDASNADALAAELAAFANSGGGTLFLGVADDGSVAGLDAAAVRRLNQLLSNAASQHVRPPVHPLTENVQTALRDKLTARILEREQLDAQVETALAGVMANGFDAQAGALGGLLRDRLQHHPALSWRAPLVELAQEMADKHLTG